LRTPSSRVRSRILHKQTFKGLTPPQAATTIGELSHSHYLVCMSTLDESEGVAWYSAFNSPFSYKSSLPVSLPTTTRSSETYKSTW